ncbi:pimeloyl-ACP methyl ester carboxylesterase [Lipingzhangella halophila]|uniref:Pimeloyl-ACP methyl ester carboxylesterase n=1 Tax=Lipingzhangella halophila TaxID=1783352 RepID=A0A7W7RIW2_9ACTN|nr:alpha/beta hydrolase [Lipingzhangella halophila]MBB4932707.1 pimeloyl-ACP methyl ester carboxylesterase [Lipingzhangella halophila]
MGETRIVYDRKGAGSPIVLLHGLGHRRQAWKKVMKRLAKHHEVIALDLPGFGKSSGPPTGDPYDLRSLVDTVQLMCAELGLQRPHFAGNSLGGAIALELGARGVAASVTALSPVGFNAVATRAGFRLLAHSARAAARIPEPVRLAAAGSRPGRAAARRILRGDHAAESAQHIRFDARKLSSDSPFVRLAPIVARYSFAAPNVPCPVTIAWGDRDRLLPPSGAQRAQRRIPHARQVMLLGCGHIPMADNPRAVAAEIMQTCRSAREDRTPGETTHTPALTS